MENMNILDLIDRFMDEGMDEDSASICAACMMGYDDEGEGEYYHNDEYYDDYDN